MEVDFNYQNDAMCVPQINFLFILPTQSKRVYQKNGSFFWVFMACNYNYNNNSAHSVPNNQFFLIIHLAALFFFARNNFNNNTFNYFLIIYDFFFSSLAIINMSVRSFVLFSCRLYKSYARSHIHTKAVR